MNKITNFDSFLPQYTYMAPILITFSLIGLLLLGLLRWVSYRCLVRSRSRGLPYPPGPPESFIFGNLRDLPSSYAWFTFTDWGKKYGLLLSVISHLDQISTFSTMVYFCLGDIFHFSVFGKHTVVLNSYEDCAEIMGKRSGIYSDRPPMPMMDLYVVCFDSYICELIGRNKGWDGPTLAPHLCVTMPNGDYIGVSSGNF